MTLQEYREKRSNEKREAILEAASALFISQGYTKAAMADIAERAGVSTATLYRHFSSKNKVFEAVVTRLVDRYGAALDAAGALGTRVGLAQLARAYAALLSDPETQGVFRAVVASVHAEPEMGEAFYTAGKTRVSARLAEAVAACAESRVLQPVDDPVFAAGQLQGMIEHGTLMKGLLMGSNAEPVVDPDAIADAALVTWLARWGV